MGLRRNSQLAHLAMGQSCDWRRASCKLPYLTDESTVLKPWVGLTLFHFSLQKIYMKYNISSIVFTYICQLRYKYAFLKCLFEE